MHVTNPCVKHDSCMTVTCRFHSTCMRSNGNMHVACSTFPLGLRAHFHSDRALYLDSSFKSDSGSQGGTDSGLHPDSGLHTAHTYFHVIFISAYPAVRVKI